MKGNNWRPGFLAFFTAIVFCLPNSILADEASRVSVGVTVPTIQAMTMRPLSFIFPAISSADMDKGFIESIRATTITVSSNLPWQLTVRSEDQDMGKVEDYIKPLSDFLWSKSSDAQYTMISTESGLVDSSANYADNREIELNYKMLVGWTRDKPGSYGLTLRFTLSTLE